MRPPRTLIAGPAWRRCWPAVVLAAAGGVCAEEGRPVPAAAPARPAEAGRPDADGEAKQIPPLPPAPVLMEQVLRGFLEAGPGRETLDDALKRAAARRAADVRAAEERQRQQFIKQQAQHYEQLLQPMLAVELGFVKASCRSLPPEARRDVLVAARQAVGDLARKLAIATVQPQAGGHNRLDVRSALRERVTALVAPVAAAAEFAAYEREGRLRQDRRAEAARLRMVATLDEQLGLNMAQRRRLLDDLAAHWQPEWIAKAEDVDAMINDRPPAPDFADSVIAAQLDPGQLERWQRWKREAGWNAIDRSVIDWSEFNALQQNPPKLDAWWTP